MCTPKPNTSPGRRTAEERARPGRERGVESVIGERRSQWQTSWWATGRPLGKAWQRAGGRMGQRRRVAGGPSPWSPPAHCARQTTPHVSHSGTLFCVCLQIFFIEIDILH